jgi:hypothetical protein
MKRSTVLSLPPQLVFPGLAHYLQCMAMGLHKCRLIRDTHTSKEKHIIDVVRFAYILSNCDIDFFCILPPLSEYDS